MLGLAASDINNVLSIGGAFVWLCAAFVAAGGVNARADGVAIVDRYGQSTMSAWPMKVGRDSDLTAAAAAESPRLKAWAVPSREYDLYGGSLTAAWHLAGTGYFTTIRHDGVWWLVSPEGNPCFYRGLDTAPAVRWETTPVTGREDLFADLPPKDGAFADAWGGDSWGADPGIATFAFCTANLIRKYGPDWSTSFPALTVERLRAWGFNGFGKWCQPVAGVPYLPVLNRAGVPFAPGGRHPDPFDPATVAKLKEVLTAQIAPHVTDPTVVAWSFSNEYDEVVIADEIAAILTDPPTVPAKRALIDYAVDHLYSGSTGRLAAAWNYAGGAPARSDLYSFDAVDIPPADIEALRLYYADQYYRVVAQAIKAIDPNHLYAGSWTVPGYWNSQADWDVAARYCDIVGVDSYGFEMADDEFKLFMRQTDKPVLCGEFSFPQSELDRGYSDFENVSLADESACGEAYEHYVADAARNPYCVGVCWFQYRDQPVTGRGPGHGAAAVYGENFPFGLIDITDQPKWKLLEWVRKTNLNASKERQSLK